MIMKMVIMEKNFTALRCVQRIAHGSAAILSHCERPLRAPPLKSLVRRVANPRPLLEWAGRYISPSNSELRGGHEPAVSKSAEGYFGVMRHNFHCHNRIGSSRFIFIRSSLFRPMLDMADDKYYCLIRVLTHHNGIENDVHNFQ